MDAGPGALQRACLEAALPACLRVMYPGWLIWDERGEWYACRRNLWDVFEAGAMRFAVHAGSPAGLWAALVTETDKKAILPILTDAGDVEYRNGVPFCPPHRVHTQGSGRDGTSTGRHLRLL